jgi:hypothetical protein
MNIKLHFRLSCIFTYIMNEDIRESEMLHGFQFKGRCYYNETGRIIVCDWFEEIMGKEGEIPIAFSLRGCVLKSRMGKKV